MTCGTDPLSPTEPYVEGALAAFVYPALPCQAWPVVKRFQHATNVRTAPGGREARSSSWSAPLMEWEIPYDVARSGIVHGTSYTEFEQLIGFYTARRGQLGKFLFDDVTDNQVVDQSLGTGDGGTVAFTLARTLGTHTAPIGRAKVVDDVKIDGVATTAYTIAGNVITFDVAPDAGAVITWSGTYYWLVRFADPDLSFENFAAQLWAAKKVRLRQLRERTSNGGIEGEDGGGGGGGGGGEGSGIEFRYDAQALVGLSHGDPLLLWPDVSGNGHDAPANDPSWTGAYQTFVLNDYPGVYFAPLGNNQRGFGLPVLNPAVYTEGEAFIVLRAAAAGGGPWWGMGSSAPGNGPSMPTTAGGMLYDSFGSGIRRSIDPIDIDPQVPWLYHVRARDGLWQCWINGALRYSTTTNTLTWTGPFFGMWLSAGAFYTPGVFWIGEFWFRSPFWDPGDAAAMESDLMAKWGISP